jgi:predicted amidohydrolase
MKLSLVQSDIIWNSPAQNAQRAELALAQASQRGAQLVAFPEMFTSGFSFPQGDLARECNAQGRNTLRSAAIAHQLHTLASLPEVDATGALFNTALLIAPDGTEHAYRKVHLFSYGDETALYSAGNSFLTVAINGVRVTIFICYDLRFAIPFYELAPHTDLFIILANWPAARREHWSTLLRARAIETQSYVAGVNRIGSGGGLEYAGDSAIFSPDGTLLADAGSSDAIIDAEISSETVATWRDRFPALKDRRPTVYQTTLPG